MSSVEYTFTLKDQLSGPLKQIQDSLRQTEAAVKGLQAALKGLGVETSTTQKSAAALNRSIGNMSKKTADTQQKVSTLRSAMNRLGSSFISNTLNAQNFKNALGAVSGANAKVANSAQNAHAGISTLGQAFHGMASAASLAREALGAFEEIMRPGFEYEHQINQMRMLGLSGSDLKLARRTAFQTSMGVPTSTQSDVLATISDIYSINKRVALDPQVATALEKMKAVLGASTQGKISGEDLERNALAGIKIAELRGQTGSSKDVKRNLDILSNIGVATHGRVTPQLMAQVLKFSGAAAKGYDDNMMYFVGHLGQEMSTGRGGGSRGIGPLLSQLYTMFVGGTMNKMTVAALEKLRGPDGQTLLPQFSGKLNTQTIKTQIAPKLSHRDLFISNPFEWAQNVLKPAIESVTGPLSKMTNVQQVGAITKSLPGLNKTQAQGLLEMLSTQSLQQYQTLAGIAKSAGGVDKQYGLATQDPKVKIQALQKSFENLAQTIATDTPLLDSVTKALNSMTGVIKQFNIAFKTYPISERIADFSKAYPGFTDGVKAIAQVLKWAGGILDTAAKGWIKIFNLIELGIERLQHVFDQILNTPLVQAILAQMPMLQPIANAPITQSPISHPAGGRAPHHNMPGGVPLPRFVPPPPPYQPGIIESQPSAAAPATHRFPGGVSLPTKQAAPIIHIHKMDVHANNPQDFWQQLNAQAHHYFDSFTHAQPQRQAPATRGAP